MRRLIRVVIAVAFAFCAYAIQSVELPGRVMACSCVPPRPLAELAGDPNHALVVATVGQRMGSDLEPTVILTIERSFTSEMPEQVLVQGIGEQGAACQLSARSGERWIFDVYRSPDGRFGVSLCSLGAPLGTDHGDALLAEAIGLFGAGATPAPPPEEPAAPVDIAPWIGGWGWLVALIGVSVVVFGAVILLASRRRSP
jgi:hypothetical protein